MITTGEDARVPAIALYRTVTAQSPPPAMGELRGAWLGEKLDDHTRGDDGHDVTVNSGRDTSGRRD